MAELVTVTISPQGEAKIEVSGAPGKKCLDLTKELEEGLGVVQSMTPTREMARGVLASQGETARAGR